MFKEAHLWKDAWLAVANCVSCDDYATAALWADKFIEDFKLRYKVIEDKYFLAVISYYDPSNDEIYLAECRWFESEAMAKSFCKEWDDSGDKYNYSKLLFSKPKEKKVVGVIWSYDDDGIVHVRDFNWFASKQAYNDWRFGAGLDISSSDSVAYFEYGKEMIDASD